MKCCIEGNEYCITQWSRLPSPNTEICWIKTSFERLQKPLTYYLMVLSGKKYLQSDSNKCILSDLHYIKFFFFITLEGEYWIYSLLLIVFPQSIGKVWHIIGPNLTSVFCKQLNFSTSKYSPIYPSRRGEKSILLCPLVFICGKPIPDVLSSNFLQYLFLWRKNLSVVCILAISKNALVGNDIWVRVVDIVKVWAWKIDALMSTRQQTRKSHSFLMSTRGINPTWGSLSNGKRCMADFSQQGQAVVKMWRSTWKVFQQHRL